MENFDKVEKYLSGAMSKEEISQFEQEKNSNPAIAQEVKRQRVEREMLRVAERDSIKRKLADLRNKNQDLSKVSSTGAKTRSLPTRRIVLFLSGLAAGVALILFFKFALSTNSHSNKAYQLALQFDPYADDTFKGDPSSSQKQFQASFIAIINQGKQEQASQAIEYFRSFSDNKEPLYPNARIYLGKAYLLHQDYPNAIKTFREIQTAPLFRVAPKQMADYYLAATYLIADQKEEAQALIQQITTTTNHRYRDRIREFERGVGGE